MAPVQRLALELPPRRAAHKGYKMPPISRAEGGQLQALVGRRRSLAIDLNRQTLMNGIQVSIAAPNIEHIIGKHDVRPYLV
jgi:hypothetical protein